jgi:hypothetical protein
VISYNLRCQKGHQFEGWFRDSAAFDRQAGDGQLLCPTCHSRRVEKAIMAPAVAGTKKSRARNLRKTAQFVTGMRKYVEENADYVGADFAEEARKIHYGETGYRHIYGETSIKEARELIEEGVDVVPLPQDPESAN